MDTAQIAATLRNLRGEKSRREVADAIGVTVSALQMYETGYRIPRDETKVRIAEFYGKTVGEIFFDREPHVSCG